MMSNALLQRYGRQSICSDLTLIFLPLVILSINHLNNQNGEFDLFLLTKRGAFPVKVLLSELRNASLHVIF